MIEESFFIKTENYNYKKNVYIKESIIWYLQVEILQVLYLNICLKLILRILNY